MAVIETWFEQDLQKAVQVQHLDGSLFSNNANGNRIGVVVYNNGVAASLSGTVSGYAVLPDGTTVPCTGSLSGNRASVLIPAAAYQPGIIFVSVFLTSGSTVTTLAAVAANVQQARTDSQVSPGSAVTDWTQTINAAMQSVVTANAANMAVEYGSLTYPVPVGKYTIYNDLLYRCITPIATAESWTASHWTRVRIADEVSDLKSALDENDIVTGTLTPTVFSNCSIYSNGAIIGSSGYNVYLYDITGIARIRIDGGSIYAFYESLPTVNVTPSIDTMRHIRTLSGAELKAPTGANYVAVRHTESPTVTDIDSLKRTVQDIEYLKSFNSKAITFSKSGVYINQSGTETSHAEYNATDFIPAAGGSLFSVHAYYSAQACFASYDADKNLVEAWTNSDSLGTLVTYKLQSNVRYVRWSLNANYDYEIDAVTAYITNTIDNLITPNERCGYNGYEINVFKHGICIGDSLTAGTFNYDDNGVNKSDYADVNYSYPKQLSKLTGIEIYSSGVGGNTSYEWYQDHISATIAGFDFAIIQFGVNDALKYHGWTSDSVAGFTGIINMLKRDNNGIKIFVATTIPALAYEGQAFNEVNNGIRTLIESLDDENVILLDMAKYASTRLKQYNAGHLTALGYSRLAKDYANYISWYIAANPDQFRAVQFIGTDKSIPTVYD